jgi:large subunit ribosomal protein L35
MPKSIARSKTRKAVAKRFKISSRGKIKRSQAGQRHLLSSKNAKRRRQAGKMVGVDKTDVARIMMNLPYS